MGVPIGHPFFGNQYTNGNYIIGTFKYISKGAENVVDYSSKLVSNNIGAGTIKIAKSKKPKNLLPNTKGFNKSLLIAGGIALAATVSGFFAYKFITKRSKTKKDALECHIGICTHCGEPLINSLYIPKSETDNHDAYIICKNCGEKNFAWYPDDNDSSDKEP